MYMIACYGVIMVCLTNFLVMTTTGLDVTETETATTTVTETMEGGRTGPPGATTTTAAGGVAEEAVAAAAAADAIDTNTPF